MIYSANTSFDERNTDLVVIRHDDKLLPIQDKTGSVGKHILKMPLSENPSAVNVRFFDKSGHLWILKNMPLATKTYHEVVISVKRSSDGTLFVSLQGGNDEGLFSWASGKIGNGGTLECSSLSKED